MRKLFTPKHKKYRPIWLAFWGLFFGSILTMGIIFMQIADELPTAEEIYSPDPILSSQLISADGKVLYRYYDRQHRISIPLDQISVHLQNALIAVEDVRFYRHSGIDHRAFLHLLPNLITGKGLRGGSTLSMQLARNQFQEIKQDPVWKRKIKEYYISIMLERHFTKKEILELYLNTVSFGENIYGIALASQRFFGVNPDELNIEQAATLAGMLKATHSYNPRLFPARSKERRNLVIQQMFKYQFIQREQSKDSLQGLPLTLSYSQADHTNGMATHFREQAKKAVQKWSESRSINLYRDGLTIFTTLDSRMQTHAESAMNQTLRQIQENFDYYQFGIETPYSLEDLVKRESWKHFWREREGIVQDLKEKYRRTFGQNRSAAQLESLLSTPRPMRIFTHQGLQEVSLSPLDSMRYYTIKVDAGFVAIDPRVGYVKAWVGGGDFRSAKYDHVYQSRRQPGSTFKPFVYAAALNQGYGPCDQFLNEPFALSQPGGEVWEPRNADNQYGGMMSMKTALAKSTNVIAAKLAHQIGIPSVVALAHNMGIESQLSSNPSLALGTSEVNLLELTNAYASFANQGILVTPIYLSRIEDKEGNVSSEFPEGEPERKRVISREMADIMIKMLEEVTDSGTARSLRTVYGLNGSFAAKTGTSQENADGWFIGMIPSLVVGVWVGWDDRRIHFDKEDYRFGAGNRTALPIAAYFFQQVFAAGRNIILNPHEKFPTLNRYNPGFDCFDSVAVRPTPQEDRLRWQRLRRERPPRERSTKYERLFDKVK